MASSKPRFGSAEWKAAIAPWQCATCGQDHISANKQVCPKCGTPRPQNATAQMAHALTTTPNAARTEAAQAAVEAMSGQTTRVYEGEDALREGIAQMAREGWRVLSQTPYQPRAGLGRTLALGVVGAFLVKPPTKWTVVFERIS